MYKFTYLHVNSLLTISIILLKVFSTISLPFLVLVLTIDKSPDLGTKSFGIG